VKTAFGSARSTRAATVLAGNYLNRAGKCLVTAQPGFEQAERDGPCWTAFPESIGQAPSRLDAIAFDVRVPVR